MSISKFQEKLFSKGCGTGLMIFFAAVMGFYGFSSCARGSMGDQEDRRSASAIATIDDVPVTADEVQKAINDVLGKYGMGGGKASLMIISSVAPMAIRQPFQSAAMVGLAAQNGLQYTPEVVTKVVETALADELEKYKASQIAAKKLSATATDADVDKLWKADHNGTSIAEQKANVLKNILAALKDPKSAVVVKPQIAGAWLQAFYAKKSEPNDADLKAGFDTYIIKKISFKDGGGPTISADTRAEKALAELKAGATFESLIDKYSDDAPQGPNRKKSDTKENYPANYLLPWLKDLKGKPLNYVSGVLTPNTGGKAIVKIVEIKSELPADFTANITKYRKQAGATNAGLAMEKDIKSFLDTHVKWTSEGYKALFDVSMAQSDPAAAATKLPLVITAAEKVLKDSKAGDANAAAIALYTAMNGLSMTGPDKVTPARRAEILEEVLPPLSEYNTYQTWAELVDTYAQLKNGAKVGAAMANASKANHDYDATGQRNYSDLSGKALKLKTDKVVTDADLAAFYAQQQVWASQMEAETKAAAEAKIQEAETKRKNEELLKQQQAASGTTAKSDADATKQKNDELLKQQKAAADAASKAPAGGAKK